VDEDSFAKRPNTRVTRLAYTVELYAVLAGLVLFFVADFVDVDPDGALGKISSILAIVSAMNFLCVIFICLSLGHALVTTTSPAGIVLLLQPIGQTFVQIVFRGVLCDLCVRVQDGGPDRRGNSVRGSDYGRIGHPLCIFCGWYVRDIA
jgi:hypothetical protein